MKTGMAVLLTLLFIFLVTTATAAASSIVVIEYFYFDLSKVCSDCPWPDPETERVNEILWTIEREYEEQVRIDRYDISVDQYWDMWSKQYNLTDWPAVVINATISLEGDEITLTELKDTMDLYLNGDERACNEEPPYWIIGAVTLSLIAIVGLGFWLRRRSRSKGACASNE